MQVGSSHVAVSGTPEDAPVSDELASAIITTVASLLGAILVAILAFWGVVRAASRSSDGIVKAD